MNTPPLKGLRVLDLTRVLAGPLCGQMLADAGAEVIKIERPDGGDETRASDPKQGGESGYFMAYNRNKLGLTLNLKSPEGKEFFLDLADRSDVVLENYRPGTMETLGLGAETLQKRNPRLIYAAISGFGRQGSRSQDAGYDIIAQAESGMMATTGWPGGQPTRTGAALTDVMAGITCAFAVMLALRQRDITGTGSIVDTALIDCAAAAMAALYAFPLLNGTTPGLEGNRYLLSCPFNSFQASDGLFVLGASNDKLWERVCRALGCPEQAQKPQFKHNADRVSHHAEVKALIESHTRHWTVNQTIAAFKAQGVPAAPIKTPDQTLKDPFLREEREMFPSITHPKAGTVRITGSSVKLSSWKTPLLAAPLLGQHNRQLLSLFAPEKLQDPEWMKRAGLLTEERSGL